VLGPTVYFTSSVVVGTEGYVFGYLITDSVRSALYCLAFMEILLVLYLVECARTAMEGEE
jgi:hypothetical protein